MSRQSTRASRTAKPVSALFCLMGAMGFLPGGLASAQGLPPAPNTASAATLPRPPRAPAWFMPHYLSLMQAPLPDLITGPYGVSPIVPQFEADADSSGILGSFQPAGSTKTSGNAFFQPLGTNGRACVTCHVPANAMGLAVGAVQARYLQSHGTDPLFAPVDGATCPKNVPSNMTSGSLVGGVLGRAPADHEPPGVADLTDPASPYALLLRKGLLRIALPVPQNAEYTLTVLSDPWGCNTTPPYDQVTDATTGITSQIVSVYRRPPMAANLKFKVDTAVNAPAGDTVFPPISPDTLLPLPTDPLTGAALNGNIMWDGREATLSTQAVDATLGHAQAKVAPTPAQVAQIVAFESRIYNAQSVDAQAGSLTSGGATGGPVALSNNPAGVLAVADGEVVSDFDAWNPDSVVEGTRRASIYRGQQIFNFRSFTLTNVAGFNNAAVVIGNAGTASVSATAQCASCHGQVGGTTDPLPQGQHDIGVGGDALALGGVAPSADLPIFQLTCKAGAVPGFHGSVVQTNDPGLALISGKCADIGRFTTPSLHGLAARPPYFSNGSAASLSDVITFYNNRFGAGLTTQDKADLVAFLCSL